jgi:hypothetical protein
MVKTNFPSSVRVDLSDLEVSIGRAGGKERDRAAKDKGLVDRLETDRDPIENEVEAYCAELAAAKHLNCYPDFNPNGHIPDHDVRVRTPTGKDFLVDVKWVPYPDYKNIAIRVDTRRKVDFYLGVIGFRPTFHLIGFVSSKVIKTLPRRKGKTGTEYVLVPLADLRTASR